MRNQKAEIRACMCHWLERLADDVLSQNGFSRRKNSLIYTRKTEESIQKIEVHIEHGPRDNRNAVAAVYPFYRIFIGEVDELLRRMVAEQEELATDGRTTLAGPIAFCAPKTVRRETGARWYLYQPDSVPETVKQMVSFLKSWAFPFLDRYCTIAGLADASTEGDDRAANSLDEVLCVITAKTLCGRHDEARALLERRFGAAGPRKQYRSVFEYLDTLA